MTVMASPLLGTSQSSPDFCGLRHRGGSDVCSATEGTQSKRSRQESDLAAKLKRTSRPSGADCAAGPVRQLSIGDPGFLPRTACKIPALLLFGMLSVLSVLAVVQPTLFYIATAVITCYVLSWTAMMSLSQAYGAYKMRKMTSSDWDAAWDSLREGSQVDTDVMHIVLLPNYKEDELMLQETLDNLGKVHLARETMHVILAMEAREGAEAERKADVLIKRSRHLFADISATFHPAGISGEIAGKSSNTQWAYRMSMSQYASKLSVFDPSHVLITVGDADTLWHPHYFNALAYQALTMPRSSRVWAIFQPPVLLLRNLFSVPGLTRVSCYGTIMFELSGLANQIFGAHMSYSTYSLTLALASHPEVNGWDTDVIAEDHHMFCKCYIASIKDAESQQGEVPIRSSVTLCSIWLPAVSYLVETDDGWWSSCHARFQQARRHSQGVAELSYMLLCYAHLVSTMGKRLPLVAHRGILCIVWKMTTVHIVNAVQAFAVLLTLAIVVGRILWWAFTGGAVVLEQALWTDDWAGVFGSDPFDLSAKAILMIFGPLPPVSCLTTATIYMVVKDMLTGRYYEQIAHRLPSVCERDPDDQQSVGQQSPVCPMQGSEKLKSWWRRVLLVGTIQQDFAFLAEPTILLFGLVPVCLAAWSLLWSGTKFEYIVAAKPH